jgi:hypothetical protein
VSGGQPFRPGVSLVGQPAMHGFARHAELNGALRWTKAATTTPDDAACGE